MKSYNSLDQRKKIIIFSLLLLATTSIASFLFASVWQKDERAIVSPVENTNLETLSPARINLLMSGNDLLSSRLNAIQQSDQRYAKLLPETNNKKSLDSINQLIYVQEEVFRASIDSIFLNMPPQADSGLDKLFRNIISSYRSVLQNRQSAGSLRNALSQDDQSLNTDQMATLRMQNELQEKNNRIALLLNEVKEMAASTSKNTIPSADEQAKENIAALIGSVNEQEGQINALRKANNNLKEEKDRLLKQVSEASKPITPAGPSLQNKVAGMQQKIDELNAELRLAQVDCNLLRVDAAKIISNSRQRKELLSEASEILTSLAQSEDAAIRRKAQDKIIRLNKVAANSRD